MKKEKISISKGQYLKDVVEKINGTKYFPSNIILNKVLTGIGATTLELDAERNSIIIEPYLPVIRGKRSGNKKILGVTEGIYRPDISAYLYNDSIKYKKIMTTPESFPKVKEAMEHLGVDMYGDYFMLIDECDKLSVDVKFRESITVPVEDFFLFRNKAFVSATAIVPSDPRFNRQGFTLVEIDPDFDYRKDLEVVMSNNPRSAFSDFVKNSKMDGDESKICVFLNHIGGIVSLIEDLDIATQSAIFCSESGKEKIKLANVTKSDKIDVNKMKKFNFFTSRFFPAVDIDIEDMPHIIVYTDIGLADFTMIDLFSDIWQIPGRFRNGISGMTFITSTDEDIQFMEEKEAKDYFRGQKEVYELLMTSRDLFRDNGQKEFLESMLKTFYFSRYYDRQENFNYFMYDSYLLTERLKSFYSSRERLLQIFETDRLKKQFSIKVTDTVYTSESIYRSPNGIESYRESVLRVVKVMDKLSREIPAEIYHIDNRPHIRRELSRLYPNIVDAYETLGREILISDIYSSKHLDSALNRYGQQKGMENQPFIRELNLMFDAGERYDQTVMLNHFIRISQKYGQPYKRSIGDLSRFFVLSKIKKNRRTGGNDRIVAQKKFSV